MAFFLQACLAKENISKDEKVLSHTQNTFKEYRKDIKEYIKNNRNFISKDEASELEYNLPFEINNASNSNIRKGILLVHGLGDSPFYFKNIATRLALQGFLVRVILLPGHGNNPIDLKYVKSNAWSNAVKHQILLIKKEVDELWLGGFSTGANLVTSYALQDESIKGLLLFSPAFKSNFTGLFLASYAKYVKTWADNEPSDNQIHYTALTMNGASLYYETTQVVQNLLKNKIYNKPVIIALSQGDSIINKEYVLSTFETKFTNSNSKLIWYGDNNPIKDKRVSVYAQKIIKEKISNISHTSILFDKNNTYYGKNGEYLRV